MSKDLGKASPLVKKTGDSQKQEAARQRVETDPLVSSFTKDAAKLLKETNRPNIITLEEFTPFMPLYQVDKDKYEQDHVYKRSLDALMKRFIRDLSINLYEVTIVVKSKTDNTNLYFLDRLFTRIKSDVSDSQGKSFRDAVPSNVSRSSGVTQDQLLLQASIGDIMDANQSTEQTDYFYQKRIESAIILKNFVQNNLSPELKEKLLEESGGNTALPTSTDTAGTLNIGFADDDED